MNVSSQGARPNYQSSLAPLTYKKEGRVSKTHEIFEGAAVLDLSEITERESHCYWNIKRHDLTLFRS
jgi:catalase